MRRRSDPPRPRPGDTHALRDRLIGLGERSMRKSYYPELQEKLADLERFRALLDQSNEAIFLASVDSGKVVDCSFAASRILRTSPEALKGVSFRDILPPITDEHIENRLAKAQDWSRLLDAIETELHASDGARIPVEFSLRIVQLGAEAYVVAVARDITDRRRAEKKLEGMNRHLEALVDARTRDLERKARELEAANRRLQELDALKSSFLSAVSHELRTPLTAVMGFSKLIARDFTRGFAPLAQDDAGRCKRARRIEENLEIITQEAERLSRLISDLLDVSKIESGTLAWNDELVDFAELAERALESVRLAAQAKRCTLETRIEGPLPSIKADPDRILQVLINLLDNAVKYAPHGVVTLGAKTGGGGAALAFSVADTGPGIPDSELSAIFDTFHQARREDTLPEGAERGTGLGLAICHQIIHHYGGAIWAESVLGKGATFHVTLPPSACALPRCDLSAAAN